MRAVDLHTHTDKSDGTFTPRELMDYAVKKELAAIALTDHDTVDGIVEAAAYVKEASLPLELIPGIELSTMYELKEEAREEEIHIVGLFIDYKSESLIAHCRNFVESRRSRNIKMCELLTEAGMPVSYEELESANKGAVITRAHFSHYMLEKGYVKTRAEAFDRYIGEDCPCYVPREKITPFEAVDVIKQAHGISVIAHPFLYNLTLKQLKDFAEEMARYGCTGIEALYSSHSPDQERTIKRIAKEAGLLISGGSDFHGKNKPDIDLKTGRGKLFVPEEVKQNLEKAWHKI